MITQIFPSKATAEKLALVFNYTGALAVGETISTKVVLATVYSGTDASPSAIISGAATNSGALVTQLTIAGVVGVIYTLTCTITTNAGQTLEAVGFLAIRPESV